MTDKKITEDQPESALNRIFGEWFQRLPSEIRAEIVDAMAEDATWD